MTIQNKHLRNARTLVLKATEDYGRSLTCWLSVFIRSKMEFVTLIVFKVPAFNKYLREGR